MNEPNLPFVYLPDAEEVMGIELVARQVQFQYRSAAPGIGQSLPGAGRDSFYTLRMSVESAARLHGFLGQLLAELERR